MAGTRNNPEPFDPTVFEKYSRVLEDARKVDATPEQIYKANRMCVVADMFAHRQESAASSRSETELKVVATWMLDNMRHTSIDDVKAVVKKYVKVPKKPVPGRSFELTFPYLASSIVQMILDGIVLDPGPRLREDQVDDG